jgi:ribosome maturation factor RimP
MLLKSYRDFRQSGNGIEGCESLYIISFPVSRLSFTKIWNQPPFPLHLHQQKNQPEGNGVVPFSFFNMSSEAAIQQVEGLANQVLADEPGYFLVSLRIKPTNNIKVFLDGDQGITIEKCVQVNRKLYKLIEESGMYPDGDFSLEVSSPGLDEPLKMHRQYVKNTGREVEVVFTDDTRKEGKMIAVTEADILLEHTEGKGKKAVTQQLLIPFSNIKSTTVQIRF